MIFSKKNIRIRVAGVIIKDNKLLLIAHKKKKKIYWLLPGGGVQFGESLEESLKREFLEELQVNIKVKEPVIICDSVDPNNKRHIVNICFLCDCDNGPLMLGKDHRLYDFKFFDKEKISNITIFPPMNSNLISIMSGEKNLNYLGKLWLDIMSV